MKNEVVVPAGVYALGDPCYFVPEYLWNKVIDLTDCFETPVISIRDESKSGSREHIVLGFGTAYGDGCYNDNKNSNNSYWVDSGTIGLVAEGLVTEENVDVITRLGARWVKFDVPTVCKNENGILTFGDIVIDTLGETDDD